MDSKLLYIYKGLHVLYTTSAMCDPQPANALPMHNPSNPHAPYLFFVCLYENLFLVLQTPIESQHSSHHVPTPQISLRTPKTRPVLPTHPPSSPLQSPNHTTQETNKMENSRRKLPQLMPHHILRDRHLVVDLPVMHLELQPHEIRQDGGGSRLGFYRRCALARLRADDGESGDCV